jgi:hypothetical protein
MVPYVGCGQQFTSGTDRIEERKIETTRASTEPNPTRHPAGDARSQFPRRGGCFAVSFGWLAAGVWVSSFFALRLPAWVIWLGVLISWRAESHLPA